MVLRTVWLLNNETPFAAERTWTRDERGAEFWLVALRAAFVIDPDACQVPAQKQTEVQRVPVFAGDPLTTALLTDSDFALHKAGTDVLLVGQAHAENGRPATQARVRLKVADVDKTLVVHGERRLYKGGIGLGMTGAAPFVIMPLMWERSYGGWDKQGRREDWLAENPAGVGFATEVNHLYDTQAPNVEYPDAPYRGPHSGRPAAFGPVAHHWRPRIRYAGTYDARWEKTRDPLVPEDFDRRYFRSAPVDQQTRKPLVGYEEVRLGGLTPEGFLGFILPRLVFDVITTFKGRGDVRQQPAIHTLWLMPQERRFEIVYLSALEVPPGREEKLVGTTIRLRPRVGTPEKIRAAGVWVQ
jgi:hypothetical protein